jgi:hypothetical protein
MRTSVDDGKSRRKVLRLLCFLLSSLLVMTVTAAVYNYMYLEAAPIGSETAKVVFADGTDSDEAGTTVGTNGTYVVFNSMSGWPNATRVYENATVIKNEDSTLDFSCQLSRDSWSGSTASIDELYVKIYDAAGTLQATLDVKAGSSASFTIPYGEVWRVEWGIRWSATALSTDSITVTLQLRIAGEGTGE